MDVGHVTAASLRLRGGAPKAASRAGASAPQTVGASWAHLHHNLPVWASDRMDQLMDTRLAPSSMRTVNSGMQHYKAAALAYDLPDVIFRNDPSRGSYLAMFVLHMLIDTDIIFASIEKYVWGVCTFMKLQHQPDPRHGVMQWGDFMSSVKVVSHVPGEPRKAMPYEHVENFLLWAKQCVVDAGDLSALRGEERAALHRMVQHVVFTLILLFTFSRSECPCPKNFTGDEMFDPKKHWQVADFGLWIFNGINMMRIRFKAKKEDTLMQRSNARGTSADPSSSVEGDWVYIGRVHGPKNHFDLMTWHRWLLILWGRARTNNEPLFVNKDMTRPYTYSCAGADQKFYFTTAMPLVSPDEFVWGIHPYRVLGYNLSKEGNGLELTVAQGGWLGASHNRYTEFLADLVVQMSANMVGAPTNTIPSRIPSKVRLGRPAISRASRAAGIFDEIDELSPTESSDDEETVEEQRKIFVSMRDQARAAPSPGSRGPRTSPGRRPRRVSASPRPSSSSSLSPQRGDPLPSDSLALVSELPAQKKTTARQRGLEPAPVQMGASTSQSANCRSLATDASFRLSKKSEG